MSFSDADDLVQDVFILALRKLDPNKNPKAWLYQVLDHLCRNFLRKELRRAKLMAAWGQPASKTALQGELDES
jgi:DNA-directed RNA polymerase specialized sigma24 family protein